MTNTETDPNVTYTVDHQRGCTRYTLNLPGVDGFPTAMVTAAVIPDRLLGTYRVIVTAGSRATRTIQTVHDLCTAGIADHDRACGYARECVRAAHQFYTDCVG